MNENIESNKSLEVTDDEGEIHFLINITYTVIVAEPGSHINNTSYYMRLIFCDTNVRYNQ